MEGLPPEGSVTEEERLYPLSAAQFGIWVAQRLAPASPMYNIGEYLEILGPVDPKLFETALRRVVAETDALHLRVVETANGPQQSIRLNPAWELPFIDVSAAADPRAAVEAWMRNDMARVVDITVGPLFGYALFHAAPDRFFWYARYHHLCNDGVGGFLIAQRLAAIYTALAEGRAVQATSPGSLFDLLEEEAAYRGSVRYGRDRAYWGEQLAYRPEPVTLSGKPPIQANGSLRQTAWVPRSMVDALCTLGTVQGLSLASVVTAATVLYLYRLTGEQDVTLGMAVSARTGARLRGIVGMVSNVLPLRLFIDPQAGFGDLLQQTVRQLRQLLRHQCYRGEELRHDLGLAPTDPEVYGTIVNVMPFDYDLRFAGHGVRACNVGNWPVADLQLVVYDRQDDGALCIEFCANPEHYTAETTAEHQQRFLTLLARLAETGLETPVSQVGLLSAAERQLVLEDFNATAETVPEATLVELFEAQVRRNPAAVAVVCGDETVSYGELNVRANQLAHYLIGLGVAPDQLVGVCLQRSVELVVALLGVLKAGGAYVPIDAALPSQRRDILVRDARLGYMVTQEIYRPLYLAGIEQVVALDEEAKCLASQYETNPGVEGGGNQAAYVNYTSGSTGQPKGVLVPQAAVVRLVHQPNYVRLDQASRLLQLAPLSFDAATFEIWGALLNGGALVIMPPGLVSVEEIGEGLQRHRVNTVWLTAGLFEQVVEQALPALAGVEQLLAGGDVLSVEHVRQVLRAHPHCQMINGYGPTENTTFTSCYAVPLESDLGSRVPIGAPISNTRVYILDGALEPVPVGVLGELYAAGTGLARGYLYRPGLTAERFVADPYGPVPSTRMYRTGDLARWWPGGTLEFVGRADHQIKVRGFRIEPGEIEAALMAQAVVAQAAVLARDDGPGGKQLIAYVVPAKGAVPDTATLRRALGEQLPAYMIPSAFIVLDSLPLTLNGKLDRQALPAPERQGESSRAPRTPEEELLCRLFAEVLGLERVGIDDNFFALGGHSLLATRLVSRVRVSLEVELAIRTLFEAPTVAELVPQLREDTEVRPPLIRRQRPDHLPLSYAQQRLWFLDQLGGTSTEYNMPQTLRLRGALDRTVLERTLSTIVERHESLRTHFAVVDGEPVQVIEPERRLVVLVEDLQGLDDAAQQAAVTTALHREWAEPFDLSRGPLLRVTLLQLREREHIFLCTFHHIVSDGWSLGVFQQEFEQLYRAFREGQESPLTPLAVQYADFALWQRRWQDDNALGQGLAYWQTQLAGIPARLELPTDRPRPAVQTFAAEAYTLSLSTDQVAALKRLSHAHQGTLYMTLLAAFVVLLARYSGQDDIVVGSPIANRQDAQLEALIGFFVNSLVMRVRVKPEARFTEVLSAVRHTTLDAYQHQDVPFERLVEALSPARSLSHTPVFQVMFALQNASIGSQQLKGLEIEPVAGGELRVRVDLEVQAVEHEGGMDVFWVYNRELFDRWRVEQMAQHYRTLLEGLVAAPEVLVSQVELLTPAERQTVLETFNATDQPLPAATLVELFEVQVRRYPDAVAVMCEDQQLTYGALNRRVNQLAQHLQDRGAGPEVVVGLCVERSMELVIGMLGIFKAGGVYLPLDPKYPQSRLAQMVTDAAPVVVLSTEALQVRLPASCPVVALDKPALQAHLMHRPTPNPTTPLLAHHPAYVLYTSGSSGRPKGVLVPHVALINKLTTLSARLGLDTQTRFGVLTSIGFDPILEQIGCPLLVGGTSVLLSDEVQADPEAFWAVLSAYSLTVLDCTPSFLESVLEASPAGLLLDTLLVGGDRFPLALLDRLHQRQVARQILNLYGPTETCIDVTAFEAREVAGMDTVPIGSPQTNYRVYVLDGRLEPVPVGVAGELYVAGIGLARGYLNQPGQTAERFVADPYGREPGGRMYRTGDVARWRPDGTLEFMGRADAQVKIRGFRVEPGEIEATLTAHDAVTQAAVLERDDGPGGKQLVAYVVPTSGAMLEAATLRRALSERLPDYMVPSAFVVLDSLPLTPNGKLDRRALPAPERHRESFRAPRTPEEELLCRLFAEVLGLERVGIDDNFFALGGHSLLATRLVSRVRVSLEVELAIRALFEAPTVAELILRLRESEAARLPLVPHQRPEHLPLSYAQQRLWFLDQLGGTSTEYNMPQALQLRGALDREALERTLNTIVARHESLHTHFTVVDGEPVQVIEPERRIAMPVEDLRGSGRCIAAGDGDDGATQREWEEPFDLSRGPLLRVKLLQLGEREHIFVCTFHHIVSDAWSAGIFNREFGALYEAFCEGWENPLAPLAVQYADFRPVAA